MKSLLPFPFLPNVPSPPEVVDVDVDVNDDDDVGVNDDVDVCGASSCHALSILIFFPSSNEIRYLKVNDSVASGKMYPTQ